MTRTIRQTILGGVTLLALGAGSGCATSGDVEKLGERIDAMNSTVQRLESRLAAAERAAQTAQSTADKAAAGASAAETAAQGALRAAEGAAGDASKAARKSEAIFDRSVKKSK